MSDKIRDKFVTPYTVDNSNTVKVSVDVLNSMQSAIGVYFDTQLIRHAEAHTGLIKFDNLGLGSKWKGHSLVVAVKATDNTPLSNKIVIEITIEGGGKKVKETLFKEDTANKEIVPFVGIFTIN